MARVPNIRNPPPTTTANAAIRTFLHMLLSPFLRMLGEHAEGTNKHGRLRPVIVFDSVAMGFDERHEKEACAGCPARRGSSHTNATGFSTAWRKRARYCRRGTST